MSEASRAAALAHAATVHQGSGDAETTLATAEAFHSFIAGSDVKEDAKPAVPAKKAATPAPAKKKPAVPPPEDDAEEEGAEEGEVTREQAGEAIEALLNANLRAKAIAIFAKYKAKSMSGVDPSNYAALKADAENALLSA